jgi:hypothetical protein
MRLALLASLLLAFDASAQDCKALFPDKQPYCPERVNGFCYDCWVHSLRDCKPIVPAEKCSAGIVPCIRSGRNDGPPAHYPGMWIPTRGIRTYSSDGTRLMSIEWTCFPPEPIPSPLIRSAVSQPCSGVWVSWQDPNRPTTTVHSCTYPTDPPTPPIQLLPKESHENPTDRAFAARRSAR